ncbi:hypothetical protein [Novosphingobium sp. ST904]|uniref:hypothetical protein n=1 Tax=Novosphingobium sp. ST904 TaxID=1684385 RepID=UPI0006C88F27|nr:hypothetical protein [Novosphingobium sp. ST904]KPH60375.1 hypothetical protein ADT71_19895 [Novosphingobium sp. ST904]TCM40077.1 hypothetical protein EDF59_105317 [Novosphingobium sp. ST904]
MKHEDPAHLRAYFIGEEEMAGARRGPVSGLLGQWKELWRSAPTAVRRELVDLACATPLLCGMFWLLWIALP